jgi:hypothetical protein
MKTKWRILFGVVILAVLIYFISKINFLEIYSILGSIKLKFFALSFAAFSLGFLIFSLRGMVSVRKIIEPDFWFFLKVTLAGAFVNVITPGAQLGGEPVRAYYLGKKYNKPKTKIFGAVLADRFFHGIVSLFFIIASLLFILTYIPVSREMKIIFQTVLFFLLAFLFLIFLLNFKKTKFNIMGFLKKIGVIKTIKNKSKIGDIEKHLGNFTSSFKKTFFNKKTLLFGILFSFCFWILDYLSAYFLFLSLEVRISFFLVIVVMSLGNLVGDLSPIPGGAGIVEGFMIFLYSLVGVNLPAAIIVSVLSRLIGYFYSLVLGGLSLLYLEKTLG